MPEVKPPLIEFRQYIIAPGQRARMIELFDAHFAEAQDALGLPILGHFRAADDADRLVWLRGFPDLPSRPDRLGAFYGGPVWAEFGREAIALVAGYNNVQVLREATPGSGIAADPHRRPPPGAAAGAGAVVATTYRLVNPANAAVIAQMQALLHSLPAGALLGSYVTEPAPNNFPALPIREGEHLYTWFARCAATETDRIALDETGFRHLFAAPPERLVLLPAARSILQ
jgi:hypothetical protein